MINLDYLVVGQGLAGSVLAHHLIRRGKKFRVVDEYKPNGVSYMAAGIMNPITGKRMAKSWNADRIIPYARIFYHDLEDLFHQRLFFQRNILRLFSSTAEQNDGLAQQTDEDTAHYLDPWSGQRYDKILDAPYGGHFVTGGGYLETAPFLNLTREYLAEHRLIVNKQFTHDRLTVKDGTVQWNGYEAKRIVFCEGTRVQQNPWFSWLPFAPAKGELLTLRITGLPEDTIINKGIFILPLGNHLFRVGATYDWDNLNDEVTDEARSYLLDKLSGIIKTPYSVVDQKAGVRPSIKDRRPVLGAHPEVDNMYVFNGMGTKAVMLAPYFADHLVTAIEEGGMLIPEVDIQRFVGEFYQTGKQPAEKAAV